jgi:hypothetical protein
MLQRGACLFVMPTCRSKLCCRSVGNHYYFRVQAKRSSTEEYVLSIFKAKRALFLGRAVQRVENFVLVYLTTLSTVEIIKRGMNDNIISK